MRKAPITAQTTSMLILLVALSTLLLATGCPPQRPNEINQSGGREGSPIVLIVGAQKTTREDIERELDDLPYWLHARFPPPNGALNYTQGLLERGLLGERGRRLKIAQDPQVRQLFVDILLKSYLDESAKMAVITDQEKEKYLKTREVSDAMTYQDVYALATASRELAAQIISKVDRLSSDDNFKKFIEYGHKLAMTPQEVGLQVADSSYTTDSKEPGAAAFFVKRVFKRRRKEMPTQSFLYGDRKLKADMSLVGEVDDDVMFTESWTVVGPKRQGHLWVVYLLGRQIKPDLEAINADQGLKDRFEAEIQDLRRKQFVDRLLE